MPRGGKRPGAGRKPKLDLIARMWIGSICEKLQRQALQDNLENEIAEKLASTNEELKRVKAIPVDKRRSFLDGEVVPIPGQGEIDYEEYLEAHLLALQQDQGIDEDQDPDRLMEYTTKGPYSVRQVILSRVSAGASEYYGQSLSKDHINKCWKEFRRIQRELGDESSE